MPARNHHVSYSKSMAVMNKDGSPGTWSIKGSSLESRLVLHGHISFIVKI